MSRPSRVSKRHHTAVIEWIARSGASFLPESDRRWSEFCTLSHPKREPLGEATIIVKALNGHPPSADLFEYRLRLVGPSASKRTTSQRGAAC
jgi:hypothetical protein